MGPFVLGTPEEYARKKALRYPGEGGPAIIRVDVPNHVIALAVDEDYFPLSQGLIQFDEGSGLRELRAIWSTLSKEVRLI
jgi:hypothetical protein